MGRKGSLPSGVHPFISLKDWRSNNTDLETLQNGFPKLCFLAPSEVLAEEEVGGSQVGSLDHVNTICWEHLV